MPVSSATIRGPSPPPCEHRAARRRDLAREVAADHARLGGDALARLGLGHVGGEDPAAHRARVADVAHERARVDARDRPGRRSRASQSSQPCSAPGASSALAAARMIAAARVDAVGLHRLRGHAVVADVRVVNVMIWRAERGVGHRLLVARHAGREHDLAGHRAGRADGLAVEAVAVLQQDVGAHAAAQRERPLAVDHAPAATVAARGRSACARRSSSSPARLS